MRTKTITKPVASPSKISLRGSQSVPRRKEGLEEEENDDDDALEGFCSRSAAAASCTALSFCELREGERTRPLTMCSADRLVLIKT